MQRISTGIAQSNYIEMSVIHGWTSSDMGYDHNMISAEDDGTATKRISFHANNLGNYFKSDHTRRLNGLLAHNQNSWDFYASAYFSK